MLRRLGCSGCTRSVTVRRRPVTIAALALAVAVPNLLAYFHARAMTTFATGGMRTDAPENLTLWNKARILATGVRLPRPANQHTPQELGLDFTTSTVRGAGGPALEIWRIPGIWHISGDRTWPLVVMFHGYGSCKSDLLPEAMAFRDLGCETILVDFRGSGGSEGNETSLGVHIGSKP